MKFHILQKTIITSLASVSLLAGAVSAESIVVTQTGDDTPAPVETSTKTTTDTSATSAKETKAPGSLSDFPSRSVVIVRQNNSRNKAFSDYMADQLANVFRYPYYNVSTRTQSDTPDLNSLEKMAQDDASSNSAADIYLAPYAKTDEYGSGRQGGMTGIFRKNMSDSDYKHTSVEGTLYYYDAQNHQSGSITKGFYGTQDALSMPSHQGVYKDVVDRMLNQLPYKRIPSDQPKYDPSNPVQSSSSTTQTTSVTNPDGSVTTTTTTTTTTGSSNLDMLNGFLKNPKDFDANQLLSLLQPNKKDKLDLASLLKIK